MNEDCYNPERLDRDDVQRMRDRIRQQIVEGMNEDWARAYEDAAFALDRLDAYIARSSLSQAKGYASGGNVEPHLTVPQA